MRGEKNKKAKGSGLIVVIMVIAFLLAVGIILLFVTGTGPEVAGNVRLQERCFNAAEAGFDSAWRYLNESYLGGLYTNFSGQYRTTYNGQPGLDESDPLGPNYANYFRNLTDQQLVEDIINDPTNAIFVEQPMPNDPNFTYTVFLINDEASGISQDDMDCLMVCIGRGPRNSSARLEIEIEIQP